MADDIVQVIANTRADATTLQQVVNGDENTQVTSRLGESYPSVQKAIKLMTQSGLSFTAFETKSLMTASSLANGNYAIVTNDTSANSGLHLKKSGAWSKVSYDIDERQKEYADTSSATAQATAISAAAADATTKANTALASAKTYADGVGSSALNQSKDYTDIAAAAALSQSKTYTDTAKTSAISTASGDATTKANAALASSNTYTDTAQKKGSANFTGIYTSGWDYERSVNSLYIVLTPFDGGSYDSGILFCRNSPKYGKWEKTLGELETYLASIERGLETAPSGATNAIRLRVFETISINPVTQEFSILHRDEAANQPDLLPLISNNVGGIPEIGIFAGYAKGYLLSKSIESSLDTFKTSTNQSIADINVSIENLESVEITPYVPDDFIEIVAHRGLADLAPENTLEAYRNAKKMGYHYVETDISATADDVLVLLHDSTIDRTSNGTGTLRSMTYAEASAYDYNNGMAGFSDVKLPTVKEFLDLCRIVGIHPRLELKNIPTSLIPSLVSLVKSTGMQGKCTYIAFSTTNLNAVKTADPDASLSRVVLTGGEQQAIIDATTLQTDTNKVSLTFNALNDQATLESLVAQCLDLGMDTSAWGIRNIGDIYKVLDAGIAGISTDGDDIWELIKARYLS